MRKPQAFSASLIVKNVAGGSEQPSAEPRDCVALNIQHGGQVPLATALDRQILPIPPSTSSAVPSITLPSQTIAEARESDFVRTGSECDFTEITPSPPRLEEPSAYTTLSNTCASEIDSPALETLMKAAKNKAALGVLSTLISYLSLNNLARKLNPASFIWSDEDPNDARWINSSDSGWDKKVARWLGVCGATHKDGIDSRSGSWPQIGLQDTPQKPDPVWDWQNAWTAGNDRTEDWTSDESVLRQIPDYVLEYAPLVHLYSGEQFWPCDIAEHLYHITPTLNYTPLQPQSRHPTLSTLDDLNQWDHARWVYLTSNDNVEERPEWLEGEKNIPAEPADADSVNHKGLIYTPGQTLTEELKKNLRSSATHFREWYKTRIDHNADGETLEQTAEAQLGTYHDELELSEDSEVIRTHLRGGRSDAPAVLITVNKGHGIVDAFWFFFYSFNLGNVVFNVRWGNHVGDWEHSAIRFHHGKPKAVFFSEHNFGSAYSYDAVEKIGKRPVLYSATGTHAMYSTPGTHPYVLPWGILHDQTDRGPLWDPALNSLSYTYDYKNDTIRSSQLNPEAPTNWFHYAGHWGDKYYPLGDKRQYRFAGQYHYVNGPLGPKFKHLSRSKICGGPDAVPCVIKNWLGVASRLRRWQGPGEGEMLPPEE